MAHRFGPSHHIIRQSVYEKSGNDAITCIENYDLDINQLGVYDQNFRIYQVIIIFCIIAGRQKFPASVNV